MKTEVSTYEQQANDFLTKTGTTLKVDFLRNDFYFHKDTEKRDIYKCTLIRGERTYSFEFGQSVMESQYYQDNTIKERSYTMNGKPRTGNYILSSIPPNQRDYSLVKGKVPNDYDILACIEKNNPGTFEEFCSEFGYDEDSRSAEKTFIAVRDQFLNIERLFTHEEMDELREIQ